MSRAFVVTLHSTDGNTNPEGVRGPFDALAKAIVHRLPIEGVNQSTKHGSDVYDAWIESVEKDPACGWTIVMRVSAVWFSDAVPVAAVAAQIPGVDAVSVTLGSK